MFQLFRGAQQKRAVLGLVALLVGVLYPLATARPAEAGTLSKTFVRFDRMTISTATTGTVCAQPATVGVEVDVQVVFPTGYTVSTTLANWTVSTTNLAWPTGGTAWPGIGTATAAAAQTVTFPSTDLTVGTLYCFNWTNTAALSIKGTATADNTGTVTIRATGPSTIDSGTYATASVSTDQISVSATVPQTFNFALSNTSQNLGTLSTGSITESGTDPVARVDTNAANGWQVWAKDSNTGLNSTLASYTIASTTPGTNSTLVAGSEGYNMGVLSAQVGGSGTITIATPFVNASTLGRGGGLDTSLRTLATSTGTANQAELTLKIHATIAGTTSAANDYADTITVVGAGLF